MMDYHREELFDIADDRGAYVKRWKDGVYFLNSKSSLKDTQRTDKQHLRQRSFSISGLITAMPYR